MGNLMWDNLELGLVEIQMKVQSTLFLQGHFGGDVWWSEGLVEVLYQNFTPPPPPWLQ